MLKIHINVPEIYLLKQDYFWDKFQRFEKSKLRNVGYTYTKVK